MPEKRIVPKNDDLDDDVVVGRRSSHAARPDAAAPTPPADAAAVDLDGADDAGGVQAQFWMTDAAVSVANAVIDELSSRAGPDGFVGRAVDEAVDLILGEDGNNDNSSSGSTADGGDGEESGGEGGGEDGGGDGASGQSFGNRSGRFLFLPEVDDEVLVGARAGALDDGAGDALSPFADDGPMHPDDPFDF